MKITLLLFLLLASVVAAQDKPKSEPPPKVIETKVAKEPDLALTELEAVKLELLDSKLNRNKEQEALLMSQIRDLRTEFPTLQEEAKRLFTEVLKSHGADPASQIDLQRRVIVPPAPKPAKPKS